MVLAKEFATSGSQLPKRIILADEEFAVLLMDQAHVSESSRLVILETPWGPLYVEPGGPGKWHDPR